MTLNPFKFGSIVDDPHFTNRKDEISQVTSVLNSLNHLVLISPRRYGKSSLIFKVIRSFDRPIVSIDLQLITSVEDLASQLLRRIYRAYPGERIRQFIRNFRIIPSISVNPVTNAVDVIFQPSAHPFPLLEDVLNMLDKLGNEKKRVIAVMDEFQEINRLDAGLAGQLRSVMQHHRNVNYVFLGSQESMIREIFEKKRSPFYHFGFLMTLQKINHKEFHAFLENRLSAQTKDSVVLADGILTFTQCHPYYTQQLAFMVWEWLGSHPDPEHAVEMAVGEIIRIHDVDFERLWGGFNRTDRKVLIGMAESGLTPLSEAFYRKYDLGAPSTVFSSIRRMMNSGYITRIENRYEIEDPFFSLWIKQRRNL